MAGVLGRPADWAVAAAIAAVLLVFSLTELFVSDSLGPVGGRLVAAVLAFGAAFATLRLLAAPAAA